MKKYKDFIFFKNFTNNKDMPISYFIDDIIVRMSLFIWLFDNILDINQIIQFGLSLSNVIHILLNTICFTLISKIMIDFLEDSQENL